MAVASADITAGSTWTGGSAPISGDANLWQSKGSGTGSALVWNNTPTSYYFYGQTLEIVSGGSLTHGTASTTQYHINNVTLDAGGKLLHGANSAWNLAFDADGSTHTFQLNGGTIALANASTTDTIALSKVNLNGSSTVTVTRTYAASGVIDFSAATVDTHLFTGIFSVTGGGQTGVTKFRLPAITDANESFELDLTDASSQLQNDQNIAVKALKLWNTTSSSLVTIAAGSYTASSLGSSYSGCFTLPSDTTHTIQVGHSVTYNANGGTGAPGTIWYVNPATLSTGAGMTYAGHTFDHWNTAADNSGTTYAGGASATLSANTTLYAQWVTASGSITAPANFPAAISTVAGTASSPTSVSISGSGLTVGITATAPTGLEVSSDNITYGSTATFSTSGGTLYARLSASASAGSYNSLNVVLSSTGANPVSVATTASGNVVVATPYWAVAASGNWGTAGNWFAGVIASGSGVTADFSQVDITSDTTVHLDTSHTIGNLIFGNTDVSPAANWIVDNNGSSGNTLTLAGGTPTVTVNNLGSGKSATISAELDGTNIIKAGTGTLILAPGTATNTMGSLKAGAGGLTLNSGTINVTNTGTSLGVGLWVNAGTLTVAGGTLNANSGNTTINGGGTLLVTNGTCNANGTSMLNGYNTAGTVTLSGTGLLNLYALRITQSTIAPGGVVNLNGGTLQLNYFASGGGTSVGTVNFNGTTVQAKSGQTAFTYVTNNNNITYNVLAGGAIFDTSTNNITIGSPLVSGSSPDGGLTKLGTGTLTLTNANTYTGNTTINAGELIGNTAGSCASSAVTVATGATNGLQLAAANGQWTCGGLTYSAGATYADFDFTATAPSTTVAPLKVIGNLAVNSTVNVIVRSGSSLTAGTSYPLITWSGTGPADLKSFGTVTLPSSMPGTLQLSGSTISVVAGIHVPNLTYTLAPTVPLIIMVSDLQTAGLASSQGNPSYTITSVGTPAHGTASIINNNIKYISSGSPASDSFTYTVSDGMATATAKVTITFAPAVGPSLTAGTDQATGNPKVTFQGLPSTGYHIQRSTPDMSHWTTESPGVTTDGNGAATWIDNNTPIPNPVFYRLVYP